MTDKTNATSGNFGRNEEDKRRSEPGDKPEDDKQNESASKTVPGDPSETATSETEQYVLNPKLGIASYIFPDGTKIEAGVPVSLMDEQREAYGEQKYHGLPVLVRA